MSHLPAAGFDLGYTFAFVFCVNVYQYSWSVVRIHHVVWYCHLAAEIHMIHQYQEAVWHLFKCLVNKEKSTLFGYDWSNVLHMNAIRKGKLEEAMIYHKSCKASSFTCSYIDQPCDYASNNHIPCGTFTTRNHVCITDIKLKCMLTLFYV